jgi:hypothetical protein
VEKAGSASADPRRRASCVPGVAAFAPSPPAGELDCGSAAGVFGAELRAMFGVIFRAMLGAVAGAMLSAVPEIP